MPTLIQRSNQKARLNALVSSALRFFFVFDFARRTAKRSTCRAGVARREVRRATLAEIYSCGPSSCSLACLRDVVLYVFTLSSAFGLCDLLGFKSSSVVTACNNFLGCPVALARPQTRPLLLAPSTVLRRASQPSSLLDGLQALASLQLIIILLISGIFRSLRHHCRRF